LRRERDAERDPDSEVKQREEGRAHSGEGSSLGHGAPNLQNKKNLPIYRADLLM